MSYVAPPVGRQNLRRLAAWIREKAGYGDRLDFPVLEFLEHKMTEFFDDFNWEIVSDNSLPGMEGLTLKIGAKDFNDYLRKAEAFKETVLSKKIKCKYVSGRTLDVYRYKYNGKYIDLQHLPGGIKVIISYGKQ